MLVTVVFRKMLLAAFWLLVFFSIVVACMTYGVIQMSQETEMEDGGDVMINKASGNAVQCANTDLYVADGTLLSRETTATSRRRQLAGANSDTATALGVRSVTMQRTLLSSMPDSYFKELLWLDIQSPAGVSVSLKVLSIARIPSLRAKCGNFLKLVTISGTIVLDDGDLYFDGDVNNLFSESGFHSFASVVDSGEKRRLKSVGRSVHISNRSYRNLVNSGVTVTGFFNSVDNDDWTCEKPATPSFPASFSAKLTVFTACNNPLSSVNPCTIYTADGSQFEGIGVTELASVGDVTLGAEKFAFFERKLFVSSDGVSVAVDQAPHFPGVSIVTKSSKVNGRERSRVYQIGADGRIFQCYQVNASLVQTTLPEDFVFFPVDELTSDTLEGFKISYKDGGDSWQYLHYYQSTTGAEPKVLATDSMVIQVDSIRSSEDTMERFEDSTAWIDDDGFQECIVETKRWQASHGHVAYPPVYKPLSSYRESDIRYFAENHTVRDAITGVVSGLTDYGVWAANILNSIETTDSTHVTVLPYASGYKSELPEHSLYASPYTRRPSGVPTSLPSTVPTTVPLATPTALPTSPTSMPSESPSTSIPTRIPTAAPSRPTPSPSSAPSQPTMQPTTFDYWLNDDTPSLQPSFSGTPLPDRRRLQTRSVVTQNLLDDSVSTVLDNSADDFSVSFNYSRQKDTKNAAIAIYRTQVVRAGASGCVNGVFCISGSTNANVKYTGKISSSAGHLVYSVIVGDVPVVMTPVGVKSAAEFKWGGGTYFEGNIIALDESATSGSVRGTVTATMMHANRFMSDRGEQMFQSGSMSIYATGDSFDGTLWGGNWMTNFQLVVPTTQWGVHVPPFHCSSDKYVEVIVGDRITSRRSLTVGSVSLVMTSGGELRVQTVVGEQVLWRTNTASPGAYASLTPEGDFVILDNVTGDVVWSTNTSNVCETCDRCEEESEMRCCSSLHDIYEGFNPPYVDYCDAPNTLRFYGNGNLQVIGTVVTSVGETGAMEWRPTAFSLWESRSNEHCVSADA